MSGFLNAQAQHRRTPDTFEVPSDEELGAIMPGNFVKVCHSGERFWVEVETVLNELVIGRVANDLFCAPLACGDTVSITRVNVYAILPHDTESTDDEEENLRHFCPHCNLKEES